MRQIQIQKPGGLENLKMENVDSPSLANDEVLMKIHASSLNYHDLMVALGLILRMISESHFLMEQEKFLKLVQM